MLTDTQAVIASLKPRLFSFILLAPYLTPHNQYIACSKYGYITRKVMNPNEHKIMVTHSSSKSNILQTPLKAVS